ncbi:DUF192 domain-containing protein [Collimonas silvisoli]|uniref:DUF192 domain-containing protein n=1 Tax=Collimonas silvisoli TaxID=2825884 RepID=UPI001B8AD104|nr:DUF192 domain-containing protein [Collimonas silvisoli]
MRKIRATYFAAAIACIATYAVAALPASAQEIQQLPVTSLNIGIHVIKAEVARSEPQREQGLMFRKKMGSNEGMVFVFDAPAGICMWMKNTLIPLSVAFIDQKGTILNVEEMKAQTLDSHCAQGAASYALEMNKNWFKDKNIKPGTVIQGLPQL